MQMAHVLVLTLLSVNPVSESVAPKIEACLSSREMSEAIAEHRAVQPLVALRAAGVEEKIRAQLCRTETGLVYLITVIGLHGHVSRIYVDASSGLRIGAR
jgi:hypothetical protein